MTRLASITPREQVGDIFLRLHDIIGRFDRLVWVMEGIAYHGWSTQTDLGRIGAGKPRSAPPKGDDRVADFGRQLLRHLDRSYDRFVAKVQDREERVAPHDSEFLPAALSKVPDRRGRCGNCGALGSVSGTL